VTDQADVTAEITFVGNAATMLRLSFALLTDPDFVPAGSRVTCATAPGRAGWSNRR